jgi:NAD-dependent SIR2 family protein deacetylase
MIGDWITPQPPAVPYRVTMHGPNIEDRCVDCGVTTYSVQRTGRIGTGGLEEDNPQIPSRCDKCGRKRWGVEL